jgi:hypothetical protein
MVASNLFASESGEGTSINSNGAEATATLSVNENVRVVTTVVAAGNVGPTVTYSISGGADAALFSIDANTGELRFISAPNYEAPNDFGSDRAYDVTVAASDGITTDTQALAITINDVNEAVAITGGRNRAISISENIAALTTITATDPENAPISYSISGGADAALFTIDSATGALSFVAAPNFEAPTDADGNNIYSLIVRATDGVTEATQNVTVQVNNVNERPVITAPSGGITINEGQTAVTTLTTTDPENGALTYSIAAGIAGGVDGSRFTINPTTGVLSFVNAPDFEAPTDVGANNVYNVIVRVSDGANNVGRAIAVTVANVNEAVTITSGSSYSLAENGTTVGTVSASGVSGSVPSYAITGGADAALFAIDAATGSLSFVGAPNFEAPTDAGSDNVYDLVVAASDGSTTDSRAIAVTVTNSNEGPVITSSAALAILENGTAAGVVAAADPEGTALNYSISGGADAGLFTIDATTGALSFATAPNFEAPADAGGDNVYELLVSASDGSLIDTQSLLITVGDVNEGPSITSNGAGDTAAVAIQENGRTVTTLSAVSAANAVITYSISGGADAALFNIDANTGALAFISAPNFETPTDADGNNVYDVTVAASDGTGTGTGTDTQALAITINDENENVAITGGRNRTISVSENIAALTTITATDPENAPISYSISDGADAALFAIDAATGALSFIAAPNFEAPTDADGNNVYSLVVRASDGVTEATQNVSVQVNNVNERPVITSAGGITINEGQTSVTTVTTADPEGGAVTYSIAAGIAGGADGARFTVNPTTGELSFVNAPDFEAPTDSGANNVYNVIVRVSDGANNIGQAIAVTVANVVDGVTLNGNTAANTLTGTVAEDTIDGRGGNDSITGGLGADTLRGGGGADVFVYNSTADSRVGATDVITDFRRGQSDKISLDLIDANANVDGNQSFNFIRSAAFSGTAGELRFEQVDGNTFVSGDINGDGVADFSIQVNGLVNFSAVDFIL